MPKNTEFGGGECNLEMNIFVDARIEMVPPHFCPAVLRGAQMGEARRGQVPRSIRSNPHTIHRAIQLRKESTLAERKLWSRIRKDQLGVTFRRHTAPAVGAGDMLLGNTSLISARLKQNSSLNWMAVNTWIKRRMMKNVRNTWNPKATQFFASGTMM